MPYFVVNLKYPSCPGDMAVTAPTLPQRCSCVFTSSPAYPAGGEEQVHTVYESNTPDLTVLALCVPHCDG